MKSIAILVFIHILAGDKPGVAVVQDQVLTGQACQQYVETHDANVERPSSVQGDRPIISSYFECLYVDTLTIDQLNKASAE